MRKFKIGDKVIPIDKTVEGWCTLKESKVWKKYKSIQGYLVINEWNKDKNCWACGSGGGCDGDFFNESDLIPYQDSFTLPKSWYVRVDENNKDILGKWRFKRSIPASFRAGCIVGIDENNSKEWNSESGNTWGEEITFEQFNNYVLKPQQMGKKK